MLLPQIESVLREKGESVPRPKYEGEDQGEGGGKLGIKGEEEKNEDDGEKRRRSGKKNFEETSEEE